MTCSAFLVKRRASSHPGPAVMDLPCQRGGSRPDRGGDWALPGRGLGGDARRGAEADRVMPSVCSDALWSRARAARLRPTVLDLLFFHTRVSAPARAAGHASCYLRGSPRKCPCTSCRRRPPRHRGWLADLVDPLVFGRPPGKGPPDRCRSLYATARRPLDFCGATRPSSSAPASRFIAQIASTLFALLLFHYISEPVRVGFSRRLTTTSRS